MKVKVRNFSQYSSSTFLLHSIYYTSTLYRSSKCVVANNFILILHYQFMQIFYIVFGSSICTSVLLSICLSTKNFHICHIFRLVRVGAFIFQMSITCDKTFLLVLSSRSSVKVKFKYQGQFSEKMAVAGHLDMSKILSFG